MSERIEVAAVWFRDRAYWLPRPGRHHHAIEQANLVWGWQRVVGRERQGFLTSTGRFVERVEAGKIALAAGQTEALKRGKQLYSEDLW